MDIKIDLEGSITLYSFHKIMVADSSLRAVCCPQIVLSRSTEPEIGFLMLSRLLI